MKTSPYFVLFAIAMISAVPVAFADHAEVTIEPLKGSGQLNVCGGKTGVECYVPGTATVDVGGKVIFSNTDFDSHTVSSGMPTDDKAGLVFNSGLIKAKESYSWTPDTVGEYDYFCLVHPWMAGKLIVQEAKAEKDDHEKDVMSNDKKDDMKEKEDEKQAVKEKDDMKEKEDEKQAVKEKDDMKEKEEPKTATDKEKGGCLIATATYGSELAPQVQQLRELRDRTILSTASGTAFMGTFNQLYYSFSPTIADLEREHPIFKEAVKALLTPMLSSLSLLNHVDIDSEQEILGYGISIILLNLGLYIAIPAFGILKLYRLR